MNIFNIIRVGIFLGWRQIKRANIWTTLLIILIMVLTFMNLVFINGILVGIVEGSSIAYREQYSGDILISNLPTKNYIIKNNEIVNLIDSLDEVESYTVRYIQGGVAEANYKIRSNFADKRDEVSTLITGIDPEQEDRTTHMASRIDDGEYLEDGDENYVLLGSRLLSEYSNMPGASTDSLENVKVGSKILLTTNGVSHEMTVKGIVKSKMQEVSLRVYVVDSFMRKFINRTDLNADEIAIRLKPEYSPELIKRVLINSDVDRNARVETWEESQGDFFKDIVLTFSLLGAIVGLIGLVVAAITIFIVIFINAIMREKQIGILKGIGINGLAIEISYVFQSFIYAVIGSGIGVLIVCGLLQPYFERNPIDFPFSDGILYAPVDQIIIRVGILLVVTLIAAYFPARMIIKKNTLDSILGR